MADPLDRLTSDERVDLLLRAWSSGAFPMADGRHGRVQFFSADPRSVLPLEEGGLKVSRSLGSLVRSERFTVRSDTVFSRVIRSCADAPRNGSWINDWIIQSYGALHAAGHAHSIEAFVGGELAGGLYGVHIGGVFFGESMFTAPGAACSGASKVCLVHLWRHLRRQGFSLLDTQYANDHMRQFGIVEVPEHAFTEMLKEAMMRPAVWGRFDAAANDMIEPRRSPL